MGEWMRKLSALGGLPEVRPRRSTTSLEDPVQGVNHCHSGVRARLDNNHNSKQGWCLAALQPAIGVMSSRGLEAICRLTAFGANALTRPWCRGFRPDPNPEELGWNGGRRPRASVGAWGRCDPRQIAIREFYYPLTHINEG